MFETSNVGIRDNGSWKLASGIVKGTDEGKAVKITAAKTVGLCSAEDKFLGVLVTIEKGNDVGVVQEKGYKEIAYSGTAPTPGDHVELVANGTGGVKTPATPGTGDKFVVESVNTSAGTLVMRLG